MQLTAGWHDGNEMRNAHACVLVYDYTILVISSILIKLTLFLRYVDWLTCHSLFLFFSVIG